MTVALELDALVHQQRRVATVVEDHVRAARRPATTSACSVHHQYSSSVSPFHANTGTPARLLGGAVGADRDRRRRVILRGEDVARRPTHLGAERDQRLDQHRRLNRHVQRAGDACAR